MNILAIDTITGVLSVSAAGPNGSVTLSVSDGGQHAPSLVQTIDTAITKAGFSAEMTDVVAVPEGPGSFTGLRLSWSAAKAISLAAECRLVPIPTLDLYARRLSTWEGPVVSVLDAKKSRFYARVYRKGKPETDSLDIYPAEIASFIGHEEYLLVTGPDAQLFTERLLSSVPLQKCVTIPSGENGSSNELLFLAREYVEEYTESEPDHTGPLYVRRSDAEIEKRDKDA